MSIRILSPASLLWIFLFSCSTLPDEKLAHQTPISLSPYVKENVTFTSDNGETTLAGTLTFPDNINRALPAVVLLHGTGCYNRDYVVNQHKYFLVLADFLTRNGIAVLRYDKRGCGESQGDFSQATLNDFASDTTGAVRYLVSRKELSISHIGLIGHSEGGMVAPMAAIDNHDIDFLILLGAPGLSYPENILLSEERMAKIAGYSDDFVKQQRTANEEIFSAVMTINDREHLVKRLTQILYASRNQLYFLAGLEGKEFKERVQFLVGEYSSPLLINDFKGHPPSYFLRKVTCPVLAITGDRDVNVPYPEEIEAIAHALEEANNEDVTIKIFPSLNHMLQRSETGLPEESDDIEETIYPGVLHTIAEWIREKTSAT
ncbi:alpha/beta hydrolase [Alteromonas ponticola]|uniref:Alpha/beta hydrolase n=1 Tax=Alteromonas aquimaris TaxID=2998417 RepID=A0ABT3P4P7_9ALTE|nr:alpha/beta hydrolase [Alteromonas aquimaris]MCW8107743.1 alpha/beta hydrolase [Alteromonas aquimaris]